MALSLLRKILSVLFISVLSSSAFAQFVTGTIAGSTGGAGRGAVDPGEASFLNPASVAHLQQYYFGSHWHSGNYGIAGDQSDYGLSLADGLQGSIMPGAFTYTRKLIELPGASANFQDLAVTLAGFPMRHMSLGVTGHRVISTINTVEDTQNNVTVGVLILPRPYLGVGIVGYDLVNSPESISPIARLNRTYAIGAHVMMTPMFRLRLDAVQPERQTGYEGRRTNVMGGLETFFNPEWAFRLGSQWLETMDQTNVTAGLGYRGPRLSLDYTFQKDVRSEGGARHLVDLWLPL